MLTPPLTLSLRKDQLEAARLLFVAFDHGGDNVVQARRDKPQPSNVSDKEIDVFAQPVLEPEHQNGTTAQDHVRQIMLSRLYGCRISTLRRPGSFASCRDRRLVSGQ